MVNACWNLACTLLFIYSDLILIGSLTMKHKKPKIIEEPFWECSVCTYQNKPEAFKCSMCNVRKGTSTRKPKVHSQLSTQTNSQFNSPTTKTNRKDENHKDKQENPGKRLFKRMWKQSKLKNVDRSSAQSREITINQLTVTITEYKRIDKEYDAADPSSTSEISSQSESGNDSSLKPGPHTSKNSHSR